MMSAAESEESRWPDFATASMLTQSIRNIVAQRSRSAISGRALSPSRGVGLGSGTGRRWVTRARLAFMDRADREQATLKLRVRADETPGAVTRRMHIRMEIRTKSRIGSALVIAGLALAGCGDEEPIPPLTTTERTVPAQAPGAGEGSDPPAPAVDKPSGPAESGDRDPRPTPSELGRAAARTVIDYVDALDAGDGAAVCALLAPGALRELELPIRRGKCARSLTASIGYRDPRGLPVWEGATASSVPVPELGAGARTTRVVVTVVTRFADRDEASIEDDIVYLVRDGGVGWSIAKPSSTLYRAVGIADVPPSVLAPP